MIVFENGHRLDFACGAGALAFNGKGWWWEQPWRWIGCIKPKEITFVSKTLTWGSREGNLRLLHPWTCVQPIGLSGNFVNAVALTNPGLFHWAKHDYPVAVRAGLKIAPSILPSSSSHAVSMAVLLSELNHIAYVEANFSCPNHNQEELGSVGNMIEKLRKNMPHPLVIKMSYEQAASPQFIDMLARYHHAIAAVHAINALPWRTVYQRLQSPISVYKHGQSGGVSGPIAKPQALHAIRFLKDETNFKIIGGNGIRTLKDIYDFEKAGADAFSIGSAFIMPPHSRPKKIIRQYRRERMARLLSEAL